MVKTKYSYSDGYKYSFSAVLIFGIFGNILVISSLMRHKNVWRNNYNFLVLQLAICDLLALIFIFYDAVEPFWLERVSSVYLSMISCYAFVINIAFQFAGVGMMLIISLLRYCATVHPLKPAISRRKLQVICGLVYLAAGLILACGTHLPLCFIKSNVVLIAYEKFYHACVIFFVCLFPTVFLATVYYKIARALIKQNKYMKNVCSNPVRATTSISILRYIRNRRTFLVCFCIAFCYGISNTPISVFYIWDITGKDHQLIQHEWFGYFANVLTVAGSYSVNPLIYGILDRKMLKFWKPCTKKKRRIQES